EMAKAYAGEMPLDTESEKILASFDNAETVLDRDKYSTPESIEAYVAALAAEADAAVADVKAGGISNAAYEIKDVTYTEGTDYNCYTFTVDVLVGDTNYKRSRIAREYKIFAIGDITIADKTVTVGPDATITSAFEGDDTLSYQWYTCNEDGTNAVAIEGATKASYTFHVDSKGTTYYKLVVNGVIESNVATFTANMPTDSIVLKFNNTYDTAKWSSNLGYTKYLGVPVYKRAHAGNTNDDTTYINDIGSYNIYLAAYPVIVVKAAYPEFPANNVDIYVGTDRDGAAPALKTGATTFQVPVGEGFMTLVFDSSTGTYKSYKADGSVHTYTTKNFGAADAAREGKLDYLRLDLSNGVNNYQKNYYFEYIGFFPDEASAIAYTGKMPADEYSNVVISAFKDAEADDTFVMEYDEAMTEEKAEAFASELYSSISAAAAAEVKEMGVSTVDVTYTAGEYTPYTIGEKFAQNGSYTFTVSVLAGDTPLQRSYLERKVTVLLKGNQPNVFLDDLTAEAGPQVTLTPEIVPGFEATSFQWYTCDANGENAVAIEDATSESYTLYPLAGTRYYMVTVNGNENSNVMALTGTLATEPVVLRFNSEQDLANWRLNGGSDKAVTTYEGKKVFTYIPGNDGSTFFDNLSEYNDFYLQSYPYFVISANYPDYAANSSVDIYIGADGYDAEYRKNHYDFNFSVAGSKPAVNHGYTKTIINATTREYKSYNANGTLICEGTGDYGFLGADTLVGKLATLRVDFSNFNAGKPCYIEYLGFFPTEEMALAYTSAMPNDADLNTIVSNVKNSITVPFAASETEATASAGVAKYAKKAIDAAAAALDKGYDAADVTVSNGVYSRPEKYGAGTYTADIDVVLGDKPFGRSQASFNTTVTLNAKPEPVIMAFDTDEKVKAASVSGHLASKTFVDESGRKFMRLITNGGGDNYLEYTNFYDQTGKTFNFQDYPYMKMSYRRSVDKSTDATAEGSQIYIANRAKYYLYYPGSDAAAPYWEQLTMDMRTNVFNYYREDTATAGRYLAGITVTNPTVLYDEQVATDNSAFHFRLTRYGTGVRTLDYEYIAFFASKEEAELYPNADRHYDTQALKAANAFTAGEGVETQAQAEKAAADYLATFDFASNYTIDTANAAYTAPTTGATGSYVFDVWFGADKKADYTVTVTMTLPVVPVTSVAKIGDVEYATLADAAANAKAGDTIILINDAVLTTDVTLPAGIILNGNGKSITGATVFAGGDLTFEGYTTVSTFHPGYNAPTITIGAGACLEMTSGRMVIGQGATFNITGNITDAKTTNVADVTPSLIAPGASFTGAGLNFNVTNAYIKFTAYASSKNSNANGTFNFDVTNSIWEQSGSLVFSEPTNGMDPTFNFNLKDSVLNSTSHLVFAVTKGDIVIDNSLVNNGAAKQLENRSNLTIKNGSVVYATNASSQNAKNPGTTTVDNATYVGSGEFTGAEVGTGAIILKNNANVTLGTVSKANVTVDTTSTLTATKFTGDENTTITIDAAGMTEGSLATIAGDMSAFAGALTVINNDALEASVDENGNIVLTKKPVYVAKIGDVEFETLDAALDYAKAQAMTEVEIIVLNDIKFSTKVNNFAKVTFTGTNREQTIDMNIGSSFESNVQLIFNDLTVSRLDGDWLGHYTYIGGGLTYNNCKMIGLFNVTAQDTDFIGCDFYNDDTFGDGSYSIWLYNCFEGVEVNITNCTFDVYERAIKVYGNGYNGKMVLNISGTEFISRTADKTVVEMAYDQSTGVGAMELNITDSTATGFGAPEHIAGDANAWFNVEGSNTSSEVTVDDVVVYSDYVVAIGNV
ncbi:MAG: hypothetical protein IJO52_06215, partial [Clostridia bacterium]|nr:hypothetical protein [Clostridia bacterium]